jgi:hypothetical protein
MGSPQYGRLLLDGEPVLGLDGVESESLVWSADGRLLAAQELVSGDDGPRTRVVVVDAERRVRVATSRATAGLSTPVRFENDELVYRHWHHRRGIRELRIALLVSE